MTVITNPNGPLNQLTSVTLASDFALLQEILMELRVQNYILKQAFGINDEDAGVRNSIVLTDLQHIS